MAARNGHLLTLATEASFYAPKVVLWRSTQRASKMTSWVGSTLPTIKGKANVSYNYYYSEKSFCKMLMAWTFSFETVSLVRLSWCCTGHLLLGFKNILQGPAPVENDLFCKCQWLQNIFEEDAHHMLNQRFWYSGQYSSPSSIRIATPTLASKECFQRVSWHLFQSSFAPRIKQTLIIRACNWQTF